MAARGDRRRGLRHPARAGPVDGWPARDHRLRRQRLHGRRPRVRGRSDPLPRLRPAAPAGDRVPAQPVRRPQLVHVRRCGIRRRQARLHGAWRGQHVPRRPRRVSLRSTRRARRRAPVRRLDRRRARRTVDVADRPAERAPAPGAAGADLPPIQHRRWAAGDLAQGCSGRGPHRALVRDPDLGRARRGGRPRMAGRDHGPPAGRLAPARGRLRDRRLAHRADRLPAVPPGRGRADAALRHHRPAGPADRSRRDGRPDPGDRRTVTRARPARGSHRPRQRSCS